MNRYSKCFSFEKASSAITSKEQEVNNRICIVWEGAKLSEGMLVKPHLRNEVEMISAEYVLGMSLVPLHRTLSVVQLQEAGHLHLGGRFSRLVELEGRREKNTTVQIDRRRNGPIGPGSSKNLGSYL